MPQARILVNSFPTSQDDVAISVLVQLDNQSLGDESTYAWSILDQPPGTTDVLSSTSTKNPSFTPKKEGTYLIKLTVDLGLPTEQSDTKVVGVRQLKTRERIPAAGESTQADSSDGWATAMNALLRRIDALLSDPGIIVGVAGGTGLTRGTILKAQGGYVIKSGLPGQETVPLFTLATAATLPSTDELLCSMEGSVSSGGTPALNALCKTRYIGRLANVAVTGGAGGSPGDTLYLDDTGRPSRTQGTVRRQIGSIMADLGGGNYDVWFDGVGGADITPITVGYMLYGAPASGMTGAKRFDGSNATGSSAGVPYTFISGDNATQSLVARAKAGQTAYLFQSQNSAGGGLGGFDSAGNLAFPNVGLLALWPNQQVGEHPSDPTRFCIGQTSINTKAFQFDTGATGSATTSFEVWGDAAGAAKAAVQVKGSAVLFGAVTDHDVEVIQNNLEIWHFAQGSGNLVADGATRKIVWPGWEVYAAYPSGSGGWLVARASDGRPVLTVLDNGSNQALLSVTSLEASPNVRGYLDADPGSNHFGVLSAIPGVDLAFGAGGNYYWKVDAAVSTAGNLVALPADGLRIRNVANPAYGVAGDRDVPNISFLGKQRPVRERFGSGINPPWVTPSPSYVGSSAWMAGASLVYDPGVLTHSSMRAGSSTSTTYSAECPFFIAESGRIIFSFHVITDPADSLYVFIDGVSVMQTQGFNPTHGGLYVSAPLAAGLHDLAFVFVRSAGAAHSPNTVAVTDVSALTEGEFRALARGVNVFAECWTWPFGSTWVDTPVGGFTYATGTPGQLLLEGNFGGVGSIDLTGPSTVADIQGGTYNDTAFGILECAARFDLSGHGTGTYLGYLGFKNGAGNSPYLTFKETTAGGKQTFLSVGIFGGAGFDYEFTWTGYDDAEPHRYTIGCNAAGTCVAIDGYVNYANQAIGWDTDPITSAASNPLVALEVSVVGSSTPRGFFRNLTCLSGFYPTP
jgi:hypothetical protein